MLDKVKLALRLSGTALDGEVSDLINAAIADLRLVGINIPAEAGSSSKTLGDPLLDRAVVLYSIFYAPVLFVFLHAYPIRNGEF